MTGCKTKLQNHLQEIRDNNLGTIKSYVAQEALDHDDPDTFFSDLLKHGCASGMVSSLIYYHDTSAFFEKYYREIDLLRCEYEENIGEQLQIKGDLKNFLAWFAFEETAYHLADELGLAF